MRGYAMVGLQNPKNNLNVGSVMRAVECYGAALVAVSGKRWHSGKTDIGNAYKNIPLLKPDDIFSLVPHDCVPVAVDIIESSQSIFEYKHPERAFYIFGPEDSTLGKKVTDKCRDIIHVPTKYCMNLAAAVNVVLYDRAYKEYLKVNGFTLHQNFLRYSPEGNLFVANSPVDRFNLGVLDENEPLK